MKDGADLVLAIMSPPRVEATMAWLDAALVSPFENGMGGDQGSIFEDTDLVGQGVDLDGAALGGVGDGIKLPPTLTV